MLPLPRVRGGAGNGLQTAIRLTVVGFLSQASSIDVGG